MKLTPREATQFFKVWSHVDAFVSQQTALVPGIKGPADVRRISSEDLNRLRTELRAKPALLERFVANNPFDLPAKELEMARRFQDAIHGTFYVERCLKQHAILVGSEGTHGVYAVQGLTEGIDEFLYRRSPVGLATMIEATLLPFNGKIVWDGMVQLFHVSFGPGIRRGFKDKYLRAKDRGEIITTLGDDATKASRAKTVRVIPDARPALERVVVAAEAIGPPDGAIQAAAFRLLKASARTAQTTGDTHLDMDALVLQLRKVQLSLGALVEAVRRQAEQ